MGKMIEEAIQFTASEGLSTSVGRSARERGAPLRDAAASTRFNKNTAFCTATPIRLRIYRFAFILFHANNSCGFFSCFLSGRPFCLTDQDAMRQQKRSSAFDAIARKTR